RYLSTLPLHDALPISLSDNSRAANRRLARMALPEGAVVAMITRGEKVIPPRGSTILQAQDHLFVVMKNDYKTIVEQVFADKGFEDRKSTRLNSSHVKI